MRVAVTLALQRHGGAAFEKLTKAKKATGVLEVGALSSNFGRRMGGWVGGVWGLGGRWNAGAAWCSGRRLAENALDVCRALLHVLAGLLAGKAAVFPRACIEPSLSLTPFLFLP